MSKRKSLNMGSSDSLLTVLGSQLDHVGAGVEVGVYRGETSRRLLSQFPALYLYLVDPWLTYRANDTYYKSGDQCSRQSQPEQAENLKITGKNIEFARHRCLVIRASSVEAGEVFRRPPINAPMLDFGIIDDDHTYGIGLDGRVAMSGVWPSIRAWWPHIKEDGILCGHDWGHPRCLRGVWGVNQAVEEFCEREELELHTENDVWWVRRPITAAGDE